MHMTDDFFEFPIGINIFFSSAHFFYVIQWYATTSNLISIGNKKWNGKIEIVICLGLMAFDYNNTSRSKKNIVCGLAADAVPLYSFVYVYILSERNEVIFDIDETTNVYGVEFIALFQAHQHG